MNFSNHSATPLVMPASIAVINGQGQILEINNTWFELGQEDQATYISS